MSRLARPAAMLALAAAIAIVLAFLINPAPAGDNPLDGYVARLSVDDHYNSNGVRLDNVAAIIRQDRANYHKFGVRDPEDEPDGFFSNVHNRALLEDMLRGGNTPGWVYDAIVNDTPLIQVTVYEGYVEVAILDENTGGGGAPPAMGGGGTGAGGAVGDVEPNSFPSNAAGGKQGGMKK
ncbi:MAG: hypothetical protein KDJ55_07285 [Rhodobiaceae bacterium]|nr:hypothetical protein [Rhodobiaceae bacterium]MCC0012053.1 hypothetical protein [Rhodobiaceae bacterium]MCC0051520.1 hypothetical protein [Rhodobiaceae bacterium]MCC0061031.1 hypothetical protein [Rhodobiaceae bacterium]